MKNKITYFAIIICCLSSGVVLSSQEGSSSDEEDSYVKILHQTAVHADPFVELSQSNLSRLISRAKVSSTCQRLAFEVVMSRADQTLEACKESQQCKTARLETTFPEELSAKRREQVLSRLHLDEDTKPTTSGFANKFLEAKAQEKICGEKLESTQQHQRSVQQCRDTSSLVTCRDIPVATAFVAGSFVDYDAQYLTAYFDRNGQFYPEMAQEQSILLCDGDILNQSFEDLEQLLPQATTVHRDDRLDFNFQDPGQAFQAMNQCARAIEQDQSLSQQRGPGLKSKLLHAVVSSVVDHENLVAAVPGAVPVSKLRVLHHLKAASAMRQGVEDSELVGYFSSDGVDLDDISAQVSSVLSEGQVSGYDPENSDKESPLLYVTR